MADRLVSSARASTWRQLGQKLAGHLPSASPCCQITHFTLQHHSTTPATRQLQFRSADAGCCLPDIALPTTYKGQRRDPPLYKKTKLCLSTDVFSVLSSSSRSFLTLVRLIMENGVERRKKTKQN